MNLNATSTSSTVAGFRPSLATNVASKWSGLDRAAAAHRVDLDVAPRLPILFLHIKVKSMKCQVRDSSASWVPWNMTYFFKGMGKPDSLVIWPCVLSCDLRPCPNLSSHLQQSLLKTFFSTYICYGCKPANIIEYTCMPWTSYSPSHVVAASPSTAPATSTSTGGIAGALGMLGRSWMAPMAPPNSSQRETISQAYLYYTLLSYFNLFYPIQFWPILSYPILTYCFLF